MGSAWGWVGFGFVFVLFVFPEAVPHYSFLKAQADPELVILLPQALKCRL